MIFFILHWVLSICDKFSNDNLIKIMKSRADQGSISQNKVHLPFLLQKAAKKLDIGKRRHFI